MGMQMSTNRKAPFLCPKCGKTATVDSGYDTVVRCKDCGETRIIMNFLSNGDIETVTADTGEYYELEPSVRCALEDVENASDENERLDAMMVLSDRYGETGREIKAEKIAKDVLDISFANIGTMRSRYCNQVPICAAFAIARGDYAEAAEIYRQGLAAVGDDESIESASMKVNYGYLCTMNKDNILAEKIFKEAYQDTEKCFAKGDIGDDPYLLATICESLRSISMKNGDTETAEKYMNKALDERRRLLKEKPVTSKRLIELADSLGFAAEVEIKKDNISGAEAYIQEALDITSKHGECKEAHAYALMNKAKFNQSRSPELPEGLLNDMDAAIPALKAMKNKDKRDKENLAQAYMFRSMVRNPNDYDGLLADIRGAYEILLELAQIGDVNEMFFMSVSHSYLVLLNMKESNAKKVQKVHKELLELGISMADLDRATRGTIGNVNSKKTKIEMLSSQAAKPIPGRRLKRQTHRRSESK